MATKIGLVSDVHSSPVPLKQALEIFRGENVDQIICCGDIAGYFDAVEPTVELLREYDCRSIVGNHDQAFLQSSHRDEYPSAQAYLRDLPQTLDLEIEGLSIFVVHANPPSEQHGGIKLLDREGALLPERIQTWREKLADFGHDILVVGHTHQVYAEQIGKAFVVNPGSSVFNHSCMILHLPEIKLETYALENMDIVKCWNFSMLPA